MLQEAFDLIKNSRNIVFATHENPDADTISSALGLWHALRPLGLNISLYNKDKLPSFLLFLSGVDKFVSYFDDGCDLVVGFDSARKDRLGLGKGRYKLINIDHHASNTNYGDINIVDTRAPSTTSVVLSFLRANGITPSKESAMALYTGLVSDSGFFRYENVTKESFLDAAYLVECGANPHEIAIELTQREPLSKIKLQAKILSTLRLREDVAFLFVTDEMLRECEAKIDEADGAAEAARTIDGVEVTLFLRELPHGNIRGSIRTKKRADANSLAAIYGGGGHKRAAGFVYRHESPFLDVAEMVFEKIYKTYKGMQ